MNVQTTQPKPKSSTENSDAMKHKNEPKSEIFHPKPIKNPEEMHDNLRQELHQELEKLEGLREADESLENRQDK